MKLSVRGRFLQKQYEMGKLDNESLKAFVEANQITAEEYKIITEIEYQS